MKKVYKITGIDCANCAAKIERNINNIPGVEDAAITFATEQLRLTAADPDALIPAILAVARDEEPEAEITHRVEAVDFVEQKRAEGFGVDVKLLLFMNA